MTTYEHANGLRLRRAWAAAYKTIAASPDRTGLVVEGQANAAWWPGSMAESLQLHGDAFRLHGVIADRPRCRSGPCLLGLPAQGCWGGTPDR